MKAKKNKDTLIEARKLAEKRNRNRKEQAKLEEHFTGGRSER